MARKVDLRIDDSLGQSVSFGEDRRPLFPCVRLVDFRAEQKPGDSENSESRSGVGHEKIRDSLLLGIADS